MPKDGLWLLLAGLGLAVIVNSRQSAAPHAYGMVYKPMTNDCGCNKG